MARRNRGQARRRAAAQRPRTAAGNNPVTTRPTSNGTPRVDSDVTPAAPADDLADDRVTTPAAAESDDVIAVDDTAAVEAADTGKATEAPDAEDVDTDTDLDADTGLDADEEPEDITDEDEDLDVDDVDVDEEDDADDEERASAEPFLSDADIDTVEIAFPKGVGLTLRHYRTVTTEDDAGEDEEVEEAVFLATKGRLHMFRSAEGLVEFVQSDAPHDLAEIDGWDEVVNDLRPEQIVADDDDKYELDLVVENLRGGRDVWESDLLISAGEVARDIAFACGLADVLGALAPGSPLDDLDEALRDGGFFARRKLKKVGTEQAAIAWRSVIGKLSAAVEWHD